ncbi:MAG: EF-P beta-lysylation protein EpmB [Gammaproteobacteria bacterium]|nr:EF-P beta-lysylation protein EpmB [Gammaproteobacteria bacterium]
MTVIHTQESNPQAAQAAEQGMAASPAQALRIASVPGAMTWQEQLQNAIGDVPSLLAAVGLVPEGPAPITDFPVRVPWAFVNRMRRGDWHDPLLLQVLAQSQEMTPVAGYGTDPVGETQGAVAAQGIVHKYRGRVLLIVTGACAVHCRYCFRRHFPYSEHQNARSQWADTLAYIRNDSTITEVILSGGDPLMASDAHLAGLVDEIGTIAHVTRLRVHSRMPVVLPDRITPSLVDALSHFRMNTVMVIHANHANELNEEVKHGIDRLRAANILSLNQAVLLAGINDSTRAQSELSEKLFAIGVLPYYLHLLDKVQGAAHFDVAQARAVEIVRQLRATLPGYLLPRLVREIDGEAAKVSIDT